MLVFAGILCGIGFLATLIRLLLGPSLPDRVIALDLLGTIAVAGLLVLALRTGESFLMDIAIVLGLIGFMGTVAFARYMQQIQDRETEPGA